MMRGAFAGIALGAAAAIVVACSAAQPPRASSMPPPMSPSVTNAGAMTPMPGGDPKGRIQQLSQKIADERTKSGLPDPAVPSAPPEGDCKPTCMIEQDAVKPVAQDAACHPAQKPTCSDSCTLSDSICKDADEICDLARQLATDAWAAGKCKEAQSSCSASHERCCSCQ